MKTKKDQINEIIRTMMIKNDWGEKKSLEELHRGVVETWGGRSMEVFMALMEIEKINNKED